MQPRTQMLILLALIISFVPIMFVDMFFPSLLMDIIWGATLLSMMLLMAKLMWRYSGKTWKIVVIAIIIFDILCVASSIMRWF